MPLILSKKTDEEKAKYLQDLFKETYIRDIEERNKIKNNDDLEELINVIASGIGCLTNPQKLASTFNSVKHIDISLPTIKQYLDYLQDSFIINKVLRYDIKGKKYTSADFLVRFCCSSLLFAVLGWMILVFSPVISSGNISFSAVYKLPY